MLLVHPTADSVELVSSSAYALGFYDVPVVSVHASSVQYSDKVGVQQNACGVDCVTQSIYPTMVRTVPAHDSQATTMIALLAELNYNFIILIHSTSIDSKAFAEQFEQLTAVAKITVR